MNTKTLYDILERNVGDLMIVEHFNIVEQDVSSSAVKLFINNGLMISNNFYIYDPGDRFMQIDVCDHCKTPGCSDSGFIEMLEFGEYIV